MEKGHRPSPQIPTTLQLQQNCLSKVSVFPSDQPLPELQHQADRRGSEKHRNGQKETKVVDTRMPPHSERLTKSRNQTSILSCTHVPLSSDPEWGRKRS